MEPCGAPTQGGGVGLRRGGNHADSFQYRYLLKIRKRKSSHFFFLTHINPVYHRHPSNSASFSIQKDAYKIDNVLYILLLLTSQNAMLKIFQDHLTSELSSKTVPVLPCFDPSFIFLFHISPTFSFCIVPVFIAIFILLSSNNNKSLDIFFSHKLYIL